MSDPGPGTDGRRRCPWAVASAEYERYHDEEWGRPVRGEAALFERLSLEAFQSGLSWITILRKREAFRRCFAAFDPVAVARFRPEDVERLMADTGIVRNRRKIEATIANARALLELDGEGLGGVLAAHRPAPAPAPVSLSDVPAITPESTALARELKALNFRFVGPTTAYAMLQAIGYVNDHLRDCWVRDAVQASIDAATPDIHDPLP
ncbi:DNA-3-methyladenine glycosylase I [Arthrobacter agilis]|uniref:DNA-3-methyladenine glycosylase I n=1 Tax=Arthrobacter agilis TaxID=37921 RepID=UPI000B356B1C|nr:DNA-3-methyladenine glycosylase I [Arthrobacter agilis]OUM41381.1 3-methyladenine DNA glycosylase [Arthrobacter agilis]PPB46287.1 DNA-3-methyladenine glycosylase I [Arthrobacter agilis]TPV27044.1 DNA-3-methyladenine glycosylase I [Arthrobacter agilis]VDR32807.1 DNA-3-methyladenine glycosylase 1 [Arthrobacter agilis]